ncbi:MAG: phosphopantetheine-binding protein [Pseudomonadota bacterium]
MTNTVGEKVIEIIAEQAMIDVSDVKIEATLDDLGLDSLALVEVVFGIEEAFDVSVPYNANDPSASEFDLSSVKAVIAAVEELVEAKGAA